MKRALDVLDGDRDAVWPALDPDLGHGPPRTCAGSTSRSSVRVSTPAGRAFARLGRKLGAGIVGLSLLAFAGCEDPAPQTVTPLPPASAGAPRRAAAAEPPSPLIVQPHLRRQEHGTASAAAPAPSGGGGGSAEPREPTEREVRAAREQIQEQIANDVDPDDDPCEQFRDLMGAHLGDAPTRAAMRQNCRHLPEPFRQCLSPSYFGEHAEECQTQMAQMAARGQRRNSAAERRLDDMERGRRPWPGQQQAGEPDDG